MILNIMMLVMMYPMMMIVCFVMYTSMKPKSGMAFGCTISIERMNDESIKEIERQWSKEMKRNIVITALLPITAFLTPYVSIQITIWTMWCFVLIVLLEWPFIKANAKVKEVKRGMGWYNPKKPEEYVELKAAGEVRRVKAGIFLLPFIVSMLAVGTIYGLLALQKVAENNVEYIKSFGVIIFMFALLNLIFLAAALWMDKQKTEVISSQSDVNINYARAKKNIWKDFWLASSWITTAYVWVCALALIMQWRFELVVLLGCIVYSLVVMTLILPVGKKIREVDARYERERDILVDGDDDHYWICGMFYNNPKDKHTMVSQRNGMGTTMNMATTAGKVWLAVAAISILATLVLCGWLMFEEFTPISLSINGDEVQALHLKVEYELPVEELEQVELVNDLPKLTRSVGSALDNLVKGKYIVRGTGERCKLFLNPQNDVFIKLEYEDMVYYLGGRTDEETMQVYEELISQ